jgi:hypothetical protein
MYFVTIVVVGVLLTPVWLVLLVVVWLDNPPASPPQA